MELTQVAMGAGHHHHLGSSNHQSIFCTSDSLKNGNMRAWDDDQHLLAKSPNPASISSDASAHQILLENMVDMIPLLEIFMDQQSKKPFPRHASLTCTPTPAPETLPLKKASEQSFKGVRGRGKNGERLLWGNANSTLHNRKGMHPEEIPMVSLSADCQADDRSEIVQLHTQMEQLEQKLQEKECQIQAALSSVRHIDIQRLQAEAAELRKLIFEKEEEAQILNAELSAKEREVAELKALLEKADVEAKASDAKLVRVQEELQYFQLLVAAFLCDLLRVTECDEDREEIDCSARVAAVEAKAMQHIASAQAYDGETQQDDIELMRRKYLAALIVARENPAEELPVLVAEFREQLQSYLMRPNPNMPIYTVAGELLD